MISYSYCLLDSTYKLVEKSPCIFSVFDIPILLIDMTLFRGEVGPPPRSQSLTPWGTVLLKWTTSTTRDGSGHYH